MSDNWTAANAADVKVGDLTLIKNDWQTITAVGRDGDTVVIHVGLTCIVVPVDSQVMVRTAKDVAAAERRFEDRMNRLYTPWYVKLLDRVTGH